MDAVSAGTETVTAYVGLGGNLGEPLATVCSAVSDLGRLPDAEVESVSSLYRSAPMGPVEQPDFVNAVAALRTALPVRALLQHLQDIERRNGRMGGGVRWGPRSLDLDILLYGRQRIADSDLVVPHPQLPVRGFVVVPLAEIAPALVVPGYGPLAVLLERVSTEGLRRIGDFDSCRNHGREAGGLSNLQ